MNMKIDNPNRLESQIILKSLGATSSKGPKQDRQKSAKVTYIYIPEGGDPYF
jgi:hypothetical protein